MTQILALTAALAMSALTTAIPVDNSPLRGAQIVGGTAAASGEFPYIVSISRGGSHLCGGVLLNAHTVVTAGHCSINTDPTTVKVRAGTLTWASGGKQVDVSSILLHPSYDAATTDNDVALWHLAAPIEAGSGIAYASLPAQGSDPVSGATSTISGWGLTAEDGTAVPAELRKVSVPVVSRETCRSEYGSSITDNMFCAGLPQGGKDACAGDSGGPIIDASTGVLIGVVSWGYGCAEPDSAGIYTRIGNYVNFINTNKWSS